MQRRYTFKIQDVVHDLTLRGLIVPEGMFPGRAFIENDPQAKQIGAYIQILLRECDLIWRQIGSCPNDFARNGYGVFVWV